ncbi:hypothetical protein GCM10029992_07980 [Glycomyces albus]
MARARYHGKDSGIVKDIPVMPDPITTALTAWVSKKLADSTAAAVRRRRLHGRDAPEVHRALVDVVKLGLNDALEVTFAGDASRQDHVRALLYERDQSEWPLLDGTYPIDLPAAVAEWIAWIEAPPGGDVRSDTIGTDHPFVARLCVAILQRIRHAATRGDRILADLWHDLNLEFATVENSVPSQLPRPRAALSGAMTNLRGSTRLYWTPTDRARRSQ